MGTCCRRAVPFDHVPMWEPGLPFGAILAALADVGYVTVH